MKKENKNITGSEHVINDPHRTQAAKVTADKDISKDPDLNSHNKNEDLDEGELARLGGDSNGLA
jgi:hypothetical protein